MGTLTHRLARAHTHTHDHRDAGFWEWMRRAAFQSWWQPVPETWWQPSGSLNASRIDSLVLDLEMQADMDQTPFYITCHARSLNCLRFRSGLGGLSFCN